jgi:ribonuclease R
MHRLGDVVEVRLVEAAPVAGALRFELLSEGTPAPRRGRKQDGRGRAVETFGRQAMGKTRSEHRPKGKTKKPGRAKKPGKSKKGK